jgi:hypothetical protein
MQMTKELLQQIINSNFKVWLLAGYPKEFKTWQMSAYAVRDMLWYACDVELYWDYEKQCVQFKGVDKNGNFEFTFKFCDSVD